MNTQINTSLDASLPACMLCVRSTELFAKKKCCKKYKKGKRCGKCPKR